jgi:hypothetical protein
MLVDASTLQVFPPRQGVPPPAGRASAAAPEAAHPCQRRDRAMLRCGSAASAATRSLATIASETRRLGSSGSSENIRRDDVDQAHRAPRRGLPRATILQRSRIRRRRLSRRSQQCRRECRVLEVRSEELSPEVTSAATGPPSFIPVSSPDAGAPLLGAAEQAIGPMDRLADLRGADGAARGEQRRLRVQAGPQLKAGGRVRAPDQPGVEKSRQAGSAAPRRLKTLRHVDEAEASAARVGRARDGLVLHGMCISAKGGGLTLGAKCLSRTHRHVR